MVVAVEKADLDVHHGEAGEHAVGHGVDDAVAQLVLAEVLLGLLVTLLAAGAAGAVVRRQLRPLTEVAATAHRVAALPLESGDIELAERVPQRLTDERTEAGAVAEWEELAQLHIEAAKATSDTVNGVATSIAAAGVRGSAPTTRDPIGV